MIELLWRQVFIFFWHGRPDLRALVLPAAQNLVELDLWPAGPPQDLDMFAINRFRVYVFLIQVTRLGVLAFLVRAHEVDVLKSFLRGDPVDCT